MRESEKNPIRLAHIKQAIQDLQEMLEDVELDSLPEKDLHNPQPRYATCDPGHREASVPTIAPCTCHRPYTTILPSFVVGRRPVG